MSLLDTIGKYVSTEADIANTLKKLKENEPHVDMYKTLIMRGCICGHELGDLQKALMKNSQHSLNPDVKNGHLENGKLGMADLITQLRMICIEMGWSFKDIEALGIQHLKERHVELKRDGWSD